MGVWKLFDGLGGTMSIFEDLGDGQTGMYVCSFEKVVDDFKGKQDEFIDLILNAPDIIEQLTKERDGYRVELRSQLAAKAAECERLKIGDEEKTTGETPVPPKK
ncbi:hypothetical protein COB72_09330 [bacterium]|nr:MAG: hypothetical protein COB72_09330 [bacterium]